MKVSRLTVHRHVQRPAAGSRSPASLTEQYLLLFGSPAIRIDAVKYVSGVVVDGAEGANDAETLIASRLYTDHTLIERSLDEQPARLHNNS
jgi:hypothetical protein